MAEQKIILQHKINLLKKKKEKIEESKNVYNNDLKLFNIFKECKDLDPTFEIPELFTTKYIIMEKLNNNNELSWENFIKNNKTDNNYNEYFSSNSYEDMFVNNLHSTTDNDNNTCEEFHIKTESSNNKSN